MRAMAMLLLAGACGLFSLAEGARGEDRAAQVRGDLARFAADGTWVYNDLDKGLALARQTGRPLMIVLRCIPCEACSQFDQQLLRKDNEVEDLFDEFVCVRLVQANGLDLSLFQFDYDQSFHIFFLNADRTIYGRFGTRSARKEEEDMTLGGLRKAMLAALALHRDYPGNKALLAGKQGRPVPFSVPQEFPSLKGKYGAKLDYQGQVVKSCIHCHQVREAERDWHRGRAGGVPEQVLFPYPLPDAVGLRMDPDETAVVADVAEGSLAAGAGLQAGDRIESAAGQPLLSTADLQWVLHQAGEAEKIPLEVRRENETRKIVLDLPTGWRRACDISWRATTWELRRIAAGGLVLVELEEQRRKEIGLPADRLALRVQYVGQYGEHAVGKRAGFQEHDVIIRVDGRDKRLSEGEFIAQGVDRKAGEQRRLVVLRGGKELELTLPIQ